MNSGTPGFTLQELFAKRKKVKSSANANLGSEPLRSFTPKMAAESNDIDTALTTAMRAADLYSTGKPKFIGLQAAMEKTATANSKRQSFKNGRKTTVG